MWRVPRRDTLALTGEAETGGVSTCCLAEKEEEERPPRHKINLFLGYTKERGDETSPTIGLDYLYRLNRTWGIGAFAERIGGEINVWAGGVGVDFHPTEEIFLFAGPGLEYITKGEDEDRVRGLLRVGGGYDFDVGRGWSIAPAVYIDFFDVQFEDRPALVLGVNIGKAWGR